MHKYLSSDPRNIFSIFATLSLIFMLILLSGVKSVYAQDEVVERVQVMRGGIFGSEDTGEYTIMNLLEGEKLYVYAQGTSGNLDPFIGLISSELSGTKRGDFYKEVQEAIDNNLDPLLVVSEFADKNFLVWDDESGGGFSAAFDYTVPADGNYYLFVVSSPFTDSFGDYQLIVGVNAPQVLNGEGTNKGEPFVVPTSKTDTQRAAVEAINDSVGGTSTENRHRLQTLLAGDTLFVHVETVEGDLVPQVVLRAFGTKPVRSANIAGSASRASLDYTFPTDAEGYVIEVIAKEGTSGTYRMSVGRNDFTVLSGEAEPYGERLLLEPIEVSIGVKLQQIANIDQKAENYEAVASTLFSWNDPALAFRPDECKCEYKLFLAKDFASFAAQGGIIYPVFTYLNQQNNRWIQNDYVFVLPNGDATYFERFTTTFQAPDFDFRQFPFDTQTFFIRVDSLFSTEFVNYVPSDFTEVGSQLGEEEWVVTDFETEVITEPSSTGQETSSFIFRFFAKRHLSFYVFRIIVPLVLILSVTWITFFMADYGKRVDATTANLLLFIAFNFTIAGELPRLGYLTYLDALLVGAFFISVLVVIYNVYLKRHETAERKNIAQKIDKFMIWVYPLGYLIAFFVITVYFFNI